MWTSRISKRPAKAMGSAEAISDGTANDESILVSPALSTLLRTEIPVVIARESNYLFEGFPSWHVPEDKSIRADVQHIRYYFGTRQIHRIMWILGSLNLADPLTKKDSNLCESRQLFLFHGKLRFSFPSSQERCSEQILR